MAHSGITADPVQEQLQRSVHRTVNELAADIEARVVNWNENLWHKTAEQLLERLAGYRAAVNEATGS